MGRISSNSESIMSFSNIIRIAKTKIRKIIYLPIAAWNRTITPSSK
jgi:hypothetical protein